ncbi:MAG: glucose-6-phosphate isomerase [Eubacteriales bacterium]|jgi:glucose-6-phosphate isomerase
MSITLKLNGINSFVKPQEVKNLDAMLRYSNELLYNKQGEGSDFLGWVDLPFNYDKEEFARIKAAGAKMISDSEVVIVIGIGGSYLGARAALEFIESPFYNNKKKDTPDIYFVGNNISSAYLQDIIDIVGDRDFSVNVISKSGTTTEPAIAFRIFKEMLEKKYGKEGAKGRIYCTTDKARGALKNLATEEGYETFVVPDDVGGRYSVLTAVGLLPMAAAGIDIDAVMKGAQEAATKYRDGGVEDNDALKYAALRTCMYSKGKAVEILVNYEPALTMFGEWYKQLFAESHGKDQKGLFPCSANFSTDLHSIGQYIQDGRRMMFETVLWLKNSKSDITIGEDKDNVDGLNFLAGKTMQYVNSKAYEGTLLAHVDGGTPNIVMEIERADAYNFGYLAYFFEKVCGLEGYLLGINPFDQPGVEAYKKNMFALLGKPGYEADGEALAKRLLD